MSDLYKSLIKSKFLEVKSDYLNGNKDSFLLKSYPKFSDAFELEEYLQKSTKINTFDLYLRELCRKDKDNIDLILLLRCRVSHAIKVNIYSMFKSIRNKDNQTLKALFNEVLEDDGERFLKFKESRSFKKYFKNSSQNEESSRKSKNYKFVKKPFNLKIIEKLYEISNDAAKDNPKIEKGRIHPFCANIILSYGSNKRTNASISTWTKYMVERNKGIKIITRRIGYRSMTPYALVADNSESQVIKAWQKFGVIELEDFDTSLKKYNKIKREKIILEIVKEIYNLYSYHYRISKDQYRETHKRDVGWRPDGVFWEKVSPKRSLLNTNIKSVDTEKIFNCIEQSLRKRSGDQFKEIPDDGNLENQPDKELDDLKENDEYHDAKEQQILTESRIKDIEVKLANSQVIDIEKIEPSDKVIFGTTITVINLESDKSNKYNIVGEDEADANLGKISYASPLAKQMIGKYEGDIIKVETPGGLTEYEIIKVEYI